MSTFALLLAAVLLHPRPSTWGYICLTLNQTCAGLHHFPPADVLYSLCHVYQESLVLSLVLSRLVAVVGMHINRVVVTCMNR